MESDSSPGGDMRKVKTFSDFTVKSIANFPSIDDFPDLVFSDTV